VVSNRLDERKLRVLSAVVQDYVATAEPVSSRTIARKYKMGVSPATIRNEMSDLEELGYLEQPHTSAGRIPSDIGYRLYVDRLMQLQNMTEQEERLLRAGFQKKAEQLEQLMQMTARVLSNMTCYLSIVFGPSKKKACFHSLYMHLISPERALLVVLTDLGMVENAVVSVPGDTSEEDLRAISDLLTTRLRGIPIENLGVAAVREFRLEMKRHRVIVEQMLQVLSVWPEEDSDYGVYTDGALNIMTQPEFSNLEKVRLVLSALQREDVLSAMLESSEPDSISISIGGENKYPEIRDCSIVWTTFVAGNRPIGSIGVLGPRRMEYGRVVALVETVREQLVTALRGNAG